MDIQTTAAAEWPAAVSSLEILEKAGGFPAGRPGEVDLPTRAHPSGSDRGDEGGLRVGFTCSKKVGNAVARNRAKRRLREVARLVLPELGRTGWDYVLIGKRDATAARPFKALCEDLRQALAKVHE